MNQASILAMFRQIQPMRAVSYPKIRVGSRGDGGYVINHALEGIGAVVSLGVGDNASFDELFHHRGVPVIQVDGTIAASPFEPTLFINKNIGKESTGETVTLAEVIDAAALRALPGGDDNMILKFDIEGAEWPMFLQATVQLLNRFRIVVGEFHGLTRLADPAIFLTVRTVFDRLCLNHQVTHIHANNHGKIGVVEGVVIPDLLEIAFLRSDFGPFELTAERIPGPLDYPNDPGRPDLVLNLF